MTDPLPNLHLHHHIHLDLNLNINLNPEMTVQDDMYNDKYRQFDALDELVLLKPNRQIRVDHSMSKVTSFVDFRPYLKSFSSWKNYISQLKEQLSNMVSNPTHKFRESDLSKVIDQVFLRV